MPRAKISDPFLGPGLRRLLQLGWLLLWGLGGCDDASFGRESVCGDGIANTAEPCDGTDLRGATCAGLGYPGGGALACAADCQLDVTGCLGNLCGDSVLDANETCDGTDLGGATCESLGFHEGGQPVCSDGCTLDSSGCTGGFCGDLIINGTEVCDGPDMSGVTCLATCLDYGFYAGVLSCNGQCELDPSTCEEYCGDGVLNGPETCDGTALAGYTCVNLGYHGGGELACASDCSALDLSGCLGGVCGDGVIAAGTEVCDGTELGAVSCASLGWSGGGTLGCSGDCTFDVTGCLGGVCGDGAITGTEACDGSDFWGALCEDYGLFSGALTCDASCQIDTAACLSDWACGALLEDVRDGRTYPTLAIGGLCWMASNLDVGTVIPTSQQAADNGIIEKYCYNNEQAMCDTYAGLYQWYELMDYTLVAGTRGICPAGWRVPTDEEWKALEIAAGMDPATADLEQWRGAPAGTELQVGGSTGFNALLGGMVTSSGGSYNYPVFGYFWTSTMTGAAPWRRCLTSGGTYSADTIGRWETWGTGYALSVRCVRDL